MPAPKIGDIFNTKHYGYIRIVEYISKAKVLVRFDDGTEEYFRLSSIRDGSIKNRDKKTIHGVACIGFGNHNSATSKTGYQCWKNMLSRCYDKNSRSYHRYGARGVTVCKDWLNFQNFCEFYLKNYKHDHHLDKDLLVIGNKIYSPATCRFIPSKLNTLLTSSSLCRGSLPVGVSIDKRNGKFTAQCHDFYSDETWIGVFDTEDEAFNAYKKKKESTIKTVAYDFFDKGHICDRIYENLIAYKVEKYPE